MRMSEAEFLNRLNKAFPEKVIFAEQSRLSEYLSLFVEIRRYARGAGVSSVQWLTGRGFIWKETGYIEPDMHSGDKCGLSPDPTAFELADYVFRTYPLAGEYQLTNKEDALLYQSASETVKKVLIDGGRTSVREETVVLLSHKKADSYIHIDVEFGEGEGKIPVDSIAKRAEAYKPKEKVTYKMIKEYIEAKYGFKVHTAYIAEVKRNLGLPMYDAPNAVEELKQPRKHPTPEKVEAIKDALRYFAVI